MKLSQFDKDMITMIIIAVVFIIICGLIFTSPAYAQPGGDDDVVDIPIDGGIAWLAIVWGAYVVARLKSIKHK